MTTADQKGWSSNSKKRAKGNKQVDLKDGAMHITFHPVADHAVSVVHPAEFQDGRVTLRFKLPTDNDSLGLNFADLKFKEVHAGHLCMTKISTKNVQINDLKTGNMKLAIRTARQNKTITPEQQEMLKNKTKRFPNKIEAGKWHTLSVTIKGQTMTVFINDKEVGSFTSEGIAHPTKRTLRVAVPKKAIIDDLKIYSLSR
ncbi:LamG domain-containing protein [bacterium]|nr:LamG domain-containing protein [bacterium]